MSRPDLRFELRSPVAVTRIRPGSSRWLATPARRSGRAACLITAAAALWLSTPGARAGDLPGPTPAPQPRTFAAVVRPGEVVGDQQIRRVFVTCGTNEFVFRAPDGFRLDASSSLVAAMAADSTYFLAFRILDAPADLRPDDLDFYRELVRREFPGAKIVEEHSRSAAGRTGPGFELRVKIAGNVERAVCVAWIPSPAGLLEFTLNADLSRSNEARNAFTAWLRSFLSNEHGKLEITPLALQAS